MAQASSVATVVEAPTLQGIWLHAVTAPEETSSNFLYGNTARSESIAIQGTAQQFIGRAYPVYDTGGFETQALSLAVVVPSGPDEQDQVEWFRAAVRARRTLCYRDNRSRKHYVILVSMSIKDSGVGTEVSFEANTVDYSEEVK